MASKILSGMRPTGRLHIGHIVGALDNWVKLQDQYDSYYFVADWHAITTQTDTTKIKEDAFEMTKDWLAAGLDPEKSTLFIQSQVPQHAELHLVLSMLNNLPRLERVPSLKAQMQHLLGVKEPDQELTQEEISDARSKISLGFLGYPVLQSADIMIYKADGVPVGEDQVPHLELTREIARKFNKLYGQVFPEPEALLTNTPRVLGTDGRKMSKSYGNTISPTDSLEGITKGVLTMLTDPQRRTRKDPGDPYVCSVYDLHTAFNDEDRQLEIYKGCISAEIGCVDCKKEVAEKIHKAYEEHSERRRELEEKDSIIREILMEGSAKARKEASETMREVKEHILFDY